VDRKFLPPKSIGYLNIKKKYRCPTRFPISSLMTLQGKRKRIISHAVFSENKRVTIFCQLLLLPCHWHCRGREPQKISLPPAFCSHFFRRAILQRQHINRLFQPPFQVFPTICTENAIKHLFTSGN